MAKIPQTDPLPILEHLIRCPSVTPEEGGALKYLEGLLGAHGFHCQRLPFASPDSPEIDNLVARLGRGGPHLCFAGHTDVVPPGPAESWTHPPFAAEQADGFIYGRGACDMKGSVAAFAAAAIDVATAAGGTFQGTLSLLLTGDEEGPSINGTVRVLQWMKENDLVPDHCLVGEPTSSQALGDTIKNGRRGSMSFTVTMTGTQGHVAYPHLADNPVPKLARLIDRLASDTLDEGNEQFDPSTLAVTTFDVGNPAGNVIPGRATAKFNIRFNTEHTPDGLRAWVERHCAAVESELGGRFAVSVVGRGDAFVTEPGAFVGTVLDAIQEETGLVPKLSTSGGTSDARFIKDYCPVIEFGPTNATIHQADERIAIDELRALARVYRAIIENYFGLSAA
ncbi:succinyl-diaminopimelate desuccinylase [soil metagenome]